MKINIKALIEQVVKEEKEKLNELSPETKGAATGKALSRIGNDTSSIGDKIAQRQYTTFSQHVDPEVKAKASSVAKLIGPNYAAGFAIKRGVLGDPPYVILTFVGEKGNDPEILLKIEKNKDKIVRGTVPDSAISALKVLVKMVQDKEIVKLDEAKQGSKIDPKYTHFLVDQDGKILDGWDYKGLDKESIKDYLTQDMKDKGIKAKDAKLLTKQSLLSKGVDPFNSDNWKKLEEVTTTVVTPDGKTLTAAQKDLLKTTKAGNNVVVKKAGEALEEAKDAKEDAPAEDAPVEDQSVETAPKSLSAELNDHIAAAIDAAAKSIQDTEDSKYEKVLGKVVKNLTAAQASLEAVQAHETKLNEQIKKDKEKTAASYSKNLANMLKKYFKNPDHIKQILDKYSKVIKQSTDKPADKLAEVIVKHALKEGFFQKGDILN